MRKIAVVLLLYTAFQANCQEYQVLHVKGEIVRVDDGSLLKPGDKITGEKQIRFKTKDAMAAVLSADKGRYIIKATDNTANQSDLIYVLKSIVSPVRGGMSSRAGGINNSIDFKLYFDEAPYVWAGDYIRLKVSSYAFPMSDRRYFFVRYEINDEVVNKKLDFDTDVLIFDKNTLFTVDENPVNPKDINHYELYYYNSANEESVLLTDIEFVLLDMKTLKELYDQYQDSSEDAYYDIADILSNLYGKCDPLQLRYNLKNQ